MSEGVVIRPLKEGDEEGDVQLLQNVFDGWPHFDLQCTPLDHWKWKYDDNPLKMRTAVVAESGGRIVGSHHGIFARAKIGSKTLLSQQGTDLAVDKDFRGMGIYNKMLDLKRAQIKDAKTHLGYSLSTNPIIEKRQRAKHTPFPSPLRHMTKIRDIDLHLEKMNSKNNLKSKLTLTGLETLNRLKNTLSPTTKQNPSLEINEVQRFDEQIEPFWLETRSNYSFIIERDTSYLNWRYCDKRGGDYTVKQATENGKTLGYLALRTNRYEKEYPIGYIVDLLTIPDRIDAADALLREADDLYTEQGVNIVHALVIQGHPYERLLETNGYVSDIKGYYLSYNEYDPKETLEEFKAAPPSRLHFMWGDLDWI